MMLMFIDKAWRDVYYDKGDDIDNAENILIIV